MKNKKTELSNAGNTNGRQSAPLPAYYKIHIKSAEDVRRLLSSTINELRQGKIDTGRAGKIIYAASVLLNVFSQYHLEERLARIEDAVRQREGL